MPKEARGYPSRVRRAAARQCVIVRRALLTTTVFIVRSVREGQRQESTQNNYTIALHFTASSELTEQPNNTARCQNLNRPHRHTQKHRRDKSGRTRNKVLPRQNRAPDTNAVRGLQPVIMSSIITAQNVGTGGIYNESTLCYARFAAAQIPRYATRARVPCYI